MFQNMVVLRIIKNDKSQMLLKQLTKFGVLEAPMAGITEPYFGK
jgi:hypothetical protein